MARRLIGRWQYWLVLVVILVVAATAGGVYAGSVQARKACTNATVKGEYGFVQTGAVIQNGARVDWAAVGRNVFDGNGTFSVTKATVSVGGSIVNLTGAGTYAVNPDCTMTFDDALTDRQAQPHARQVQRGGVPGPAKGLEDAVRRAGWQPDPFIAHR